MQVGFIGLGKMGANMVRRILRDSDYEVVAWARTQATVAEVEAHGETGAGSVEDLVVKLRRPRVVWLMVPSGEPTQDLVEQLLGLLSAGDTIVDGGNSKWTDSIARHAQAAEKGIRYVDVGTSGGIWGLEVGYCLMVGGDAAAVTHIAPILDVLAPPPSQARRQRGWARMGETGSGHYVKMVHNGIEYGMMQAYSEGFELLHRSDYALDNKEIANLWGQGSVVRSWLLELAGRALAADGNDLTGLAGCVDDSGEGRWTLENGIDHDVPMPALAAALYARWYSRNNGDYAARLLSALRNQFGGHAVHPSA
jgi:6-phosphogluconate dehydrogenase